MCDHCPECGEELGVEDSCDCGWERDEDEDDEETEDEEDDEEGDER
jgi:hypothetical protein